MSLIEFISYTLAVLVIVAQVLMVLSVFYFIFLRKRYPIVENTISKHSLLLSFIVALVATTGSLFYSEIAGFVPCTLCWYQRIFMYPQVVLLGIALVRRDHRIIDYSLALSLIGMLLAGYHYLLQLGVVTNAPCSAIGYSVSCAKLFVMQFGYLTIPLMSFTVFALLVVISLFYKLKNKHI